MRLILIDDDVNVRDNLRTLLTIYSSQISIVAEADGVAKGLECIRKYKPDLVLLDVEMKDGTGFDLLAMYGQLDFKVIFVTGHDAYAIKAFRYSALDYLLKPVDPVELMGAVGKAMASHDQTEHNLKMETLIRNKGANAIDQKVVLKDAETVYLISIRDIVRCESQTNYTWFYLIDGRRIIVSKTLKEFDSLFEGKYFFRAHQSHLVNLLHFDRYEKKEGGTIHMKDGSTLPVAVRKKDSLMAALEQL